MQPINLRSFKQKLRYYKKSMKGFLTKIEKKPPKNLHAIVDKIDAEIWKETDCLSCANCCKTMTPTFTLKDMKRIAAHLSMTVDEFKKTWLDYDKKEGDWMNKNQPCQFLNLKDNKCMIYEVRPADCAGFPHLTKRKMVDYIHVHKQNIQYCPATFRMVEKLMEAVK